MLFVRQFYVEYNGMNISAISEILMERDNMLTSDGVHCKTWEFCFKTISLCLYSDQTLVYIKNETLWHPKTMEWLPRQSSRKTSLTVLLGEFMAQATF